MTSYSSMEYFRKKMMGELTEEEIREHDEAEARREKLERGSEAYAEELRKKEGEEELKAEKARAAAVAAAREKEAKKMDAAEGREQRKAEREAKNLVKIAKMALELEVVAERKLEKGLDKIVIDESVSAPRRKTKREAGDEIEDKTMAKKAKKGEEEVVEDGAALLGGLGVGEDAEEEEL